MHEWLFDYWLALIILDYFRFSFGFDDFSNFFLVSTRGVLERRSWRRRRTVGKAVSRWKMRMSTWCCKVSTHCNGERRLRGESWNTHSSTDTGTYSRSTWVCAVWLWMVSMSPNMFALNILPYKVTGRLKKI